MKLTSSHASGMDSLREIADKLPLKVVAIHNERGTLCVNLSAPLGRYQTSHVEWLWQLDPINFYLRGEPLDLENEEIPNPFAEGGFASGFAKTKPARGLKRRDLTR